MSEKQFRNEILGALKSKGLNQTQAAEKLGKSKTWVYMCLRSRYYQRFSESDIETLTSLGVPEVLLDNMAKLKKPALGRASR